MRSPLVTFARLPFTWSLYIQRFNCSQICQIQLSTGNSIFSVMKEQMSKLFAFVKCVPLPSLSISLSSSWQYPNKLEDIKQNTLHHSKGSAILSSWFVSDPTAGEITIMAICNCGREMWGQWCNLMGRCPGKHPRTKSGRLKSNKTPSFYMFPHRKLQGEILLGTWKAKCLLMSTSVSNLSPSLCKKNISDEKWEYLLNTNYYKCTYYKKGKNNFWTSISTITKYS